MGWVLPFKMQSTKLGWSKELVREGIHLMDSSSKIFPEIRNLVNMVQGPCSRVQGAAAILTLVPVGRGERSWGFIYRPLGLAEQPGEYPNLGQFCFLIVPTTFALPSGERVQCQSNGFQIKIPTPSLSPLIRQKLSLFSQPIKE